MANHDVKTPWEGWYVINKIGKGGFGSVYEIERSQYGIQERAAMKVITIPQSADEIDDLLIEGYDNNSITRRFDAFAEDIVREYGMMAQMKGNANIVYCDDYKIIQQDNGFGRDIYIRMELLTPLLKAMDRVSSEPQIIRFGMEMCNALEACQKRKVIHRDIKPQNIFVSDDGVFKLGDFGIARKAEKTTQATVGKGTYQFMAPEVKNEQPYGPTVDMYSLGLVMYWLLNNRRCPFFPLPPAVPTHKEEQEALRRRFSGEKIPAPKNGSEELKQIVLKACAFDPKDRYQSAREMREDLVRLSDGYAPELQPEVMPEPEPAVDPILEEEATVGPLFTNKTAAEVIEEKTVGPEFSSKTKIEKTKQEQVAKPKMAIALALTALCILGAALCSVYGGSDSNSDHRVVSHASDSENYDDAIKMYPNLNREEEPVVEPQYTPTIITEAPTEYIQETYIQETEPPRTPSVEDVRPFGEVITYPKTSAYLEAYEIRYVKAPKGHSIYVFWNPDGGEKYRRKYLLYEGDEVTVLARQGDFSCVIFTSQSGEQQIGWANSACLVG